MRGFAPTQRAPTFPIRSFFLWFRMRIVETFSNTAGFTPIDLIM